MKLLALIGVVLIVPAAFAQNAPATYSNHVWVPRLTLGQCTRAAEDAFKESGYSARLGPERKDGHRVVIGGFGPHSAQLGCTEMGNSGTDIFMMIAGTAGAKQAEAQFQLIWTSFRQRAGIR
jgi:hypothetical protein